jgi:mannose-6-phosphate isomerase-like protein (cupin superfamily)
MLEKTDFQQLLAANHSAYYNAAFGTPNDHVVRIAKMTAPYDWHRHPDSDETFIGVEGTVIIETPDGVLELTPGSCITIPANMPHRTRPKSGTSVNLTVEKADMTTVFHS